VPRCRDARRLPRPPALPGRRRRSLRWAKRPRRAEEWKVTASPLHASGWRTPWIAACFIRIDVWGGGVGAGPCARTRLRAGRGKPDAGDICTDDSGVDWQFSLRSGTARFPSVAAHARVWRGPPRGGGGKRSSVRLQGEGTWREKPSDDENALSPEGSAKKDLGASRRKGTVLAPDRPSSSALTGAQTPAEADPEDEDSTPAPGRRWVWTRAAEPAQVTPGAGRARRSRSAFRFHPGGARIRGRAARPPLPRAQNDGKDGAPAGTFDPPREPRRRGGVSL